MFSRTFSVLKKALYYVREKEDPLRQRLVV